MSGPSRKIGVGRFALSVRALSLTPRTRKGTVQKQGKPRTRYSFRYTPKLSPRAIDCMLVKKLEARVGIEPTHKGFADLSLTTWVPRLGWAIHFEAPLNCR